MREPIASPHVSLTLDLPTESAAKGWALYDHTILTSVSDSFLVVKYGSLPNPGDGFRFLGLPNMNTSSGTDIGFGNHLVTLKVDGKTFQQAHIQTFFSATASNYPGADTDYTASNTDPAQRFATPNWYHYYDQVYTAAGKYEKGNSTHTDFFSPYTIHIDDLAYGDIAGTHVYALKPGDSYISWAGDVELYGLWLDIAVNAHEQEHKDAATDGTYSVDTTNTARPLAITSDGDRLDNTWEDNHYFRSDLPNTTRALAYPNETDKPDDEAIADIVGIGKLLDLLDDWQQDWAGVPSGQSYIGGIQFGTSHFAIKPGETIPKPFFWFTPGSIDASGRPIYGTRIKIWSKADLKAAVPNLMTTLVAKPDRP